MRGWLLVTALASAACGGAAGAAWRGEPDRPVPASEPRGVVRARLDLETTQGCEETFDLAVYRNRAIDLVEWDENGGACAARLVSVRYLSRRTDERAVLDLLRAHALRVVVEPRAAAAKGTP
jgi:hypothetical protein